MPWGYGNLPYRSWESDIFGYMWVQWVLDFPGNQMSAYIRHMDDLWLGLNMFCCFFFLGPFLADVVLLSRQLYPPHRMVVPIESLWQSDLTLEKHGNASYFDTTAMVDFGEYPPEVQCRYNRFLFSSNDLCSHRSLFQRRNAGTPVATGLKAASGIWLRVMIFLESWRHPKAIRDTVSDI